MKKEDLDKSLVREQLEEEELLFRKKRRKKAGDELLHHLMKEAKKGYSAQDEKAARTLLSRLPQERKAKEPDNRVWHIGSNDYHHKKALAQAISNYPKVHTVRMAKSLAILLFLAGIIYYLHAKDILPRWVQMAYAVIGRVLG